MNASLNTLAIDGVEGALACVGMLILLVICIVAIVVLSKALGWLLRQLAKVLETLFCIIGMPVLFVVFEIVQLWRWIWINSLYRLRRKSNAVRLLRKKLNASPWPGLAVMIATIVGAAIYHLSVGSLESFATDTVFAIPILNFAGWFFGVTNPFTYGGFKELVVCAALILILRGRKRGKAWTPTVVGFWDVISTLFSAVIAQWLPMLLKAQTLDEAFGEHRSTLFMILIYYIALVFSLYVLYDFASSVADVAALAGAIILPCGLVYETTVDSNIFEVGMLIVYIITCFQRARPKKHEVSIDIGVEFVSVSDFWKAFKGVNRWLRDSISSWLP